MEMLLMGACLSIFGLAVTALAFRAAMPAEENKPPAAPPVHVDLPEHFFVQQVPIPQDQYRDVPIEGLLLQIENHVRLEQAAAESFLAEPNATLLHARTISSFVN